MKKLLPILIGLSLSGFSSLSQAENLMQVYQQARLSNPELRKSAFGFIAQRLNLLFQFFPVEPAKGNLISVHILNEPRFPHFVTAQCLPLTVMLRDISHHRMRV